ncbi:glucose-6-phosphate dehydrogenase assembly protein OpcA [Georgenia sp. TF02-10]|uniref:glucose-6-phosphate dehydrogenase assembly protein OpcA n=1 Tax=Georgenia sp. TF02-10 TaxID=2917725 RepID=UPI001FA6E712|nr:glucose-6-phosphate dehydrogenase assembly protein OpcA [Georgenia sp. TF02-10]UNX56202.1 glucose-6-phosphate dehydrogenase assembly protein OpcA [Georgenia sp. TF02-10]
MIVNLRGTTSAAVGNRLVSLREEGGVVALGRVLTLVVLAPDEQTAERAIRTANDVSREHPARVLVVLPDAPAGSDAPASATGPEGGDGPDGEARLDAQIRVGGDAGASEVVLLKPRGGAGQQPETLVMSLLLPDAPIVAWWPTTAPPAPSTDPIGRMAQRRITDSTRCADPVTTLARLAGAYAPGDSDLAWAALTLWRSVLAAALDEPPAEPVTAVTVSGAAGHPSVDLLAAWLGLRLRCPARTRAQGHDAVSGVVLERPSGPITLTRPQGSSIAVLTRPGRVDQQVNIPLRDVRNSLMEDLRRLDPDVTYGEVLTEGLPLVRA